MEIDKKNQTTTVTYFVFSRFSYSPTIKAFLFLIFSFMYATTLVGNMMIMLVIRGNNKLNGPMYFFLSHLAFLDICFSSVTVPRLLMMLSSGRIISYEGCITQMLLLIFTGGTETYLLAAMAYDRFVAICKPLHYIKIMNQTFCSWLVGGSWTIGFGYAMANTLPVLKLTFCGSNVIQGFSCEFPSVVALSCTETFLNEIIFCIIAGAVVITSLFIIFLSYIHIISTILKMNSPEAKRKTFSTCTSHLIVVTLFYSMGTVRYMRPETASSMIMDTLFSIQYSICTPMLNPIIYSLKTREVKEAIKKLMG